MTLLPMANIADGPHGTAWPHDADRHCSQDLQDAGAPTGASAQLRWRSRSPSDQVQRRWRIRASGVTEAGPASAVGASGI